jgi:hypothetical protein
VFGVESDELLNLRSLDRTFRIAVCGARSPVAVGAAA